MTKKGLNWVTEDVGVSLQLEEMVDVVLGEEDDVVVMVRVHGRQEPLKKKKQPETILSLPSH